MIVRGNGGGKRFPELMEAFMQYKNKPIMNVLTFMNVKVRGAGEEGVGAGREWMWGREWVYGRSTTWGGILHGQRERRKRYL